MPTQCVARLNNNTGVEAMVLAEALPVQSSLETGHADQNV